MSNNNVINGRRGLQSPKVIGAIVIVALICIIVLWLKVVRGSEETGSDLVTFIAKRGPLTISVLESGTIKPRERIIIKNELEGRMSILSLIAEGVKVKKGDLLVELDASTLADAMIDQEISVQNAEAAFIDANESLAVAENQAQSDIDVANLTLKFAEQDLQQYKEGQYPKDFKTAINEITLREEELTRAQDTLDWSQKLFAEKYLSNTDLQADKLAVTRSKNGLELAKEELRLLNEYTRQRNIDQFESDFHQAKMALERIHRKAKADVVQAKAGLKARELANDPQIIFADEPTGNLDSITGEQIMEVLAKLNRQGKTIIMVTHEPNIAAYADSRLHMIDGVVDRIEVSSHETN